MGSVLRMVYTNFAYLYTEYLLYIMKFLTNASVNLVKIAQYPQEVKNPNEPGFYGPLCGQPGLRNSRSLVECGAAFNL